MIDRIGRNIPPPRDKNAPKLLVTKYGALPDDSLAAGSSLKRISWLG